eukprot:COSAG05_NODE_4009_length_1723_cov_1.474754_2_plen_165_part_01
MEGGSKRSGSLRLARHGLDSKYLVWNSVAQAWIDKQINASVIEACCILGLDCELWCSGGLAVTPDERTAIVSMARDDHDDHYDHYRQLCTSGMLVAGKKFIYLPGVAQSQGGSLYGRAKDGTGVTICEAGQSIVVGTHNSSNTTNHGHTIFCVKETQKVADQLLE